MRKSIILIIVLSVLAIAFVACTGNNDAPPAADPPAQEQPAPEQPAPEQPAPDPTPTDDQVSGDLFIWMHHSEAFAEAMADAFMRDFPDVNVTWEHVGFTDQRDMITLDGPAGIGPDVWLQPHDGVALAINDGLVEPLPTDMQERLRGRVLTAAIDTATHNGVLYGVPFQTETIALFYNRAYVPTAPSSFEEIIEFAREWNDPAQNRFAMRWQINDAYHNYAFLTAFGFTVFGPNMDDWRAMDFDTDAVRRGIEFHASLREVFDFGVDDFEWDNTVAAFQRGEVPFTISGPWAIGDARANGVDFGVTRLPTVNGVQPRSFSGAGVAHISSFTENLPASLAFVEWMASDAAASVIFNEIGNLAALYDVSGVPGLAEDPHLSGIALQAAFANPMPTIPEVDLMWGPLATVFTHTWNGTMTAEETAALAQQEYLDALAVVGLTID